MLGNAFPANDPGLVGAGEAAPRAFQSEKRLDWSLHAPEQKRTPGKPGRGKELAPSGEVASPEPFGAQRHVDADGDCQNRAQCVVPAEQGVAGGRNGGALGPHDAGDQAAEHHHRGGDSRCAPVGAALTADKTWPDPAEFDDDQERDGDPARVMDGEDPSATGGSGEQRERAGHEQRRDQRRETPVGAAGGHSVSLGAQAGRFDRPRAQGPVQRVA